jgi:NAD(P)H-dependent flavin oxidoreductase YrpB (nitropropane dioxygenase family)
MSEAFLPGSMPRLIQAGMGIRVSGFRLARETSRLGALGVVSAVALRHVVIEEVRAGDPEAIAVARTFPVPRYVEELLAFAPGGEWQYRSVPLDMVDPVKGALPRRLSVIAAYVEVMRAKRGHAGKVGINVMWKCPLTVLPSIYGAFLAGVDALLCGAGVPMELPEMLGRMQAGENLHYEALHGTGTPVHLEIADDGTADLLRERLRPKLLPILSNFAFPKRIMDIWEREQQGVRPFAFVLENHAAGGHNAPPRNKTEFGEQDNVEAYFDKVVALGVPVYVAGAFANGGTVEDYHYWRDRGAYGIQVGSRFALCDESDMRRDIKDAIIQGNSGTAERLSTSLRVSPTGYPFKVLSLPGTVADPVIYARRRRRCDKGYLLQARKKILADGKEQEVYICPAMPARQFERLVGDPAETEGRLCLCNGLLATVGFGNGSEPPLVTLGLSGNQVFEAQSARTIIEEILSPGYVAVAECCLRRTDDCVLVKE